jgi:hypothetical protein
MKAEKIKPPCDSEQLYGMLKVRYPAPSWALIPQVADGTGWRTFRWADAVAMCCWPSLGLELHGFEIKVDRHDFLREIRNGAKSQAIFAYCDRWWLVVDRGEIVEPGELPPTWGLLAPRGGQLRAVKEAPKLEPKPFSREFLASILRNALAVVVPDAKLKAEYDRGFGDGIKQGEEGEKYLRKELDRKLTAHQQAIKAFEGASGLKFGEPHTWMSTFEGHEELGVAVRQVLAGQDGEILRKLQVIRDRAREVADVIDRKLMDARNGSMNEKI